MLRPAASGKFIAENASHIKIRPKGIEKAVKLLFDRIESGDISLKNIFTKTEIHPQTADVQGVNWIFFADLLNFSFWSEEKGPQYGVTYKNKRYTGYLALCAAINRSLEKGIPLTEPKYFGSISYEDLNACLTGDDGVPCPMIQERHFLLKDASEMLLSKYQGSFVNCIQLCNKSALTLLELIIKDFPAFDDKAVFQGQEVVLMKRAQILISDIWSLFEGKGLGEFHDVDQLTMFPDYRVPQSLQYLGVFEYSKDLLNRLNSPELLPNGSHMEVEIRGCSIEAVEQIKNAFRDSEKYDGDKHGFVNSALIDYFLWGFRRELAEEMKAFPFHKTRSIYY